MVVCFSTLWTEGAHRILRVEFSNAQVMLQAMADKYLL
jgi:hypothetical protein